MGRDHLGDLDVEGGIILKINIIEIGCKNANRI
jgi:hypothetical protein